LEADAKYKAPVQTMCRVVGHSEFPLSITNQSAKANVRTYVSDPKRPFSAYGIEVICADKAVVARVLAIAAF
jgi:hypothetical protein